MNIYESAEAQGRRERAADSRPPIDKEIPKILRAVKALNRENRPLVFDPAFKQYPDAYKLGEIKDLTDEERLRLQSASTEVRNHLLRLVAQSRWKTHLVLRGSTLMQGWFGDAAREPKDIDWVFIPRQIEIGADMSRDCFDDLIEMVKNQPHTSNAHISVDKIASDDIWTYERADGRRIVFPFEIEGGGRREIQMDVVWGEYLFDQPIESTFNIGGEGDYQLLTASRELSLAWKILWLANDCYPQGKDLYDAVLLGENMPLPVNLLYQVLAGLESCEPGTNLLVNRTYGLGDLQRLRINWKDFKNEYPWIEGTLEEWQDRLNIVLAPLFTSSNTEL